MPIPTELVPLRLHPGDDLRAALLKFVTERECGAAFVLAGIGSLGDARLRFAGESAESVVPGPLEIISLSGSVTPSGAHMHMAVSDSCGKVIGGHVCAGNIVRTTVEAVLAFVPEWDLSREFDSATGYDELLVRRKTGS
ncbi:MAG: PPC domain-containing DNA-binding protein [Pseudomonadota bacterium]